MNFSAFCFFYLITHEMSYLNWVNLINFFSQSFQFNLAILDHPDVTLETKKALQTSTSESITHRLPLCVEISLQTVEGDKMILEVWSLNNNLELCDPSSKATYPIYNRMGLLLKSLISVTRITPAYKLSRRQTADSYHIYYRIYVGEPQTHNLGKCFNLLTGTLVLCTELSSA